MSLHSLATTQVVYQSCTQPILRTGSLNRSTPTNSKQTDHTTLVGKGPTRKTHVPPGQGVRMSLSVTMTMWTFEARIGNFKVANSTDSLGGEGPLMRSVDQVARCRISLQGAAAVDLVERSVLKTGGNDEDFRLDSAIARGFWVSSLPLNGELTT